MVTTLVILGVASLFFVKGWLRSDVVALCSLAALLLCGILSPEVALAVFSSTVVIMMVALFVVGGAVFQTGLAKMMSSRLMKLAGGSELGLYLLVMLVTGLIGAFVSNTGTVALMLPIVVSLATSAGVNPARLLMPLAFASSMGGMMTLIGTPPNLVIADALEHAGYERLTFFSFTPVGIICLLVGIVALYPLVRLFLSGRQDEGGSGRRRHKSLRELVEEYGLDRDLWLLKITDGSPAAGHAVPELDVQRRYGLTVLEVRRVRGGLKSALLGKDVYQEIALSQTRLQPGDLLYVSGRAGQVRSFATAMRLEVVADADSPKDGQKADSAGMGFYKIGVAELLLMPTSRLQNCTVRDSRFREKYRVNVLGVQHKQEYRLEGLADVKLHAGDRILVQGSWEHIARLTEEQGEWVVLGQPLEEAARVTLDYKAPVAALIMLAMVVCMMFDSIPVAPVTAAIVAALLMVLTGCLRNVEAAYKTINWESIMLIAAMLPMSKALEKTGASEWVSSHLVSGLGDLGPLWLLAGIYFTTSLLTLFISNTATAVLLAPIALSAAQQVGASPMPFLFAVTIAASMCFASPFSTPPNALVMPAGGYRFSDYVKVGLPLQVVMGVAMVFLLPLLFPF